MTGEGKPLWGFIADDLTGACIVGGKLANVGARPVVATDLDADPALLPRDQEGAFPPGTVIGVNAESRNVDRETAVRRVARAAIWLRDIGCQKIFKFIDSSLRGHVGAELDAVLEALGVTWAVVVPGTPSFGRVVKGGHLYIEGVPAHMSPHVRSDVFSKLDTDDVSEIFGAGSGRRYVSIDVHHAIQTSDDDGADDRDFARQLVESAATAHEHGAVPILCAATDLAIRRIAATIRDTYLLGRLHVLCGSVGLAEAWAEEIVRPSILPEADLTGMGPTPTRGDSPTQTRAAPRPPPVLVVCGSRAAPSKRQVQTLAASGVPCFEILDASRSRLRPVEDVAPPLTSALERVGKAILTTCIEHEPPYDDEGRRGRRQLASAIPEHLGAIVRTVLGRDPTAATSMALTLVGGMTAANVLRQVGVAFLVPVSEHDFVVQCLPHPGHLGIHKVATKGGASGGADALLRAVEDNTRPREPRL